MKKKSAPANRNRSKKDQETLELAANLSRPATCGDIIEIADSVALLASKSQVGGVADMIDLLYKRMEDRFAKQENQIHELIHCITAVDGSVRHLSKLVASLNPISPDVGILAKILQAAWDDKKLTVMMAPPIQGEPPKLLSKDAK